jgi:hypothetical protein
MFFGIWIDIFQPESIMAYNATKYRQGAVLNGKRAGAANGPAQPATLHKTNAPRAQKQNRNKTHVTKN